MIYFSYSSRNCVICSFVTQKDTNKTVVQVTQDWSHYAVEGSAPSSATDITWEHLASLSLSCCQLPTTSLLCQSRAMDQGRKILPWAPMFKTRLREARCCRCPSPGAGDAAAGHALVLSPCQPNITSPLFAGEKGHSHIRQYRSGPLHKSREQWVVFREISK